MKKSTKLTLILFLLLVGSAIPLYIYTHRENVKADAITISGNLAHPLTIDLNQLQNQPQLTLQVTLSSSSKPAENGVFTYTGVPLKDLLDQANISANASSVYIQSVDGYGISISIYDATKSNTILACKKDNQVLTSLKDGGEGPIRLIIGDDEFAQRWIRGVSSIEVK